MLCSERPFPRKTGYVVIPLPGKWSIYRGSLTFIAKLPLHYSLGNRHFRYLWVWNQFFWTVVLSIKIKILSWNCLTRGTRWNMIMLTQFPTEFNFLQLELTALNISVNIQKVMWNIPYTSAIDIRCVYFQLRFIMMGIWVFTDDLWFYYIWLWHYSK